MRKTGWIIVLLGKRRLLISNAAIIEIDRSTQLKKNVGSRKSQEVTYKFNVRSSSTLDAMFFKIYQFISKLFQWTSLVFFSKSCSYINLSKVNYKNLTQLILQHRTGLHVLPQRQHYGLLLHPSQHGPPHGHQLLLTWEDAEGGTDPGKPHSKVLETVTATAWINYGNIFSSR